LRAVFPAKVKIGFDWQRAKEGHSLFVNKRIEKKNEAHVIEGFMGFAHAIGVPSFKPSWQMPVTDADKAFAKQQLDGMGKVLVIAPAASGAERNWVASRYVEVAEYAHNQGFSVVLTGGPTKLERDLAAEIMTLANFPIVDLVAKTTLKQLLCLLEQASLGDCPRHRSCAYGGLHGNASHWFVCTFKPRANRALFISRLCG
jgi:heptosyltransferase I